ncbi:MAG: P22 phage major capsid protein family protein [Thermodesulfobacteriota bacterium]|nr:P22 phage major capsid protein family protein [Thermodesulfobacteriota bacterium]
MTYGGKSSADLQSVYAPEFWAQEALIVLENNLVLANLVHRDFEQTVARSGDLINTRKPAAFTAQDFVETSGIDLQDAGAANVAVSLNKYKDVSFALPSKAGSMSVRSLVEEFIVPAMSAHAQAIDADLAALYKDVYYYHGTAGTTPDGVDDIVGARKIMNTNKVPLERRRLVMDEEAEYKFLQLAAFYEADKVGDQGTALREASLGRKFGLDMYMDQNIQDHTVGTWVDDSGSILVNSGSCAVGDTSCPVDAITTGKTIKAGDMFTVANDDQPYVITQDATAASSAATLNFSPGAKTVWAEDAAVTVIAGHTANLAFHRNAFALVTRPLAPPLGGNVRSTVMSYNGVGLRVSIGYDLQYKQDVVSIDLLYGVKTLDPELAVRLLG